MPRTFRVRIRRQGAGGVLATCEAPVCLARGPDEATAIRRIREEIRYRLEWCPCSGVAEDYVKVEVVRG